MLIAVFGLPDVLLCVKLLDCKRWIKPELIYDMKHIGSSGIKLPHKKLSVVDSRIGQSIWRKLMKRSKLENEEFFKSIKSRSAHEKYANFRAGLRFSLVA
ncbi:hypothetical protein [Arcanobacterium hippocoleae]|uniref:hypothetical protein n=1 Tax=Arcanobacterium hippocoleae TaxID=149017 RepID=UPI003340CA91